MHSFCHILKGVYGSPKNKDLVVLTVAWRAKCSRGAGYFLWYYDTLVGV